MLSFLKVIDFQTQMKNFEEVQKSLMDKIGKKRAENLISEAVYFISIGSNDYMGGYLGHPEMQHSYNPQQYVNMVIGNLTDTIQVSISSIFYWVNLKKKTNQLLYLFLS